MILVHVIQARNLISLLFVIVSNPMVILISNIVMIVVFWLVHVMWGWCCESCDLDSFAGTHCVAFLCYMFFVINYTKFMLLILMYAGLCFR